MKLTIEQANDILESLKFWPFGDSPAGTFEVGEDGTTLHMFKHGYDSRAWKFGDSEEDDTDFYEENIDLENFHQQNFQINLRFYDLDTEANLLMRVAELVGYAMAHEGLEWLRRADGSLVHDPHADGDVHVVIPEGIKA